MPTIVNTHQAEAWNGYEGGHWASHQDRWDAVSEELNRHLLAAASIGESDRVLDIGCGNGQSTRLAARQASRGHALGVDLSGPMLDRARATAVADGIVNARFEQGDAQVHPFPAGGFDVAISRGGIMFFADPVAAFRNIGRALRPAGRLAFVCPQEMARQDWFVVTMSALFGWTPDPGEPGTPGMFSLADRGWTEGMLSAAGFRDIGAVGVEIRMTYGRDAADAAEFFLGTGPVRHLLGRTSSDPERARNALTAALLPYETPDGVRLPGSFWAVSATRP